MSVYFSRYTTMPSAAATWRANGHELGIHPYFAADGATIPGGYQIAQTWFATTGLAPASPTERHHSVEWAGWTDPLSTMVANGIRMDTSYYAWGPSLYNPTRQNQAHGYITGSGLPMRFVSQTGSVFPVYQQVTALVDEQLLVGSYAELLTTSAALAVSQQLIDDSQAGGYSAIATQFHVDYATYGDVAPWVDGTMAYAQSLQVPMWTMERWLRFVEARAATSVSNMNWAPGTGTLTFSVAVPAGAAPQTLLLPQAFGGAPFLDASLDGQALAVVPFQVNGQDTAAFQVGPAAGGSARQVRVRYGAAPPIPSLAIADAAIVESDAGTSTATMEVSLSEASGNPVSVAWATADGTATAGVDYVAASGIVTFLAGTTTQPIVVTILGDARDEPNETVVVTLSNASGATLADPTGVLAIIDDDPAPALSVGDVTVTEGHTGFTAVSFPVSLSGASGRAVTVDFATVGGTATAGVDFGVVTGSLTFAPGVTALTIPVPIVGDLLSEPTESFTVTLASPVNASIADGSGLGRILDDDPLPAAGDDGYTTGSDTPLDVPAPGVLANDTSFGAPGLRVTLVSDVVNGTLALRDDGGFRYVPRIGFVGIDAFTYRASSASGAGGVASVAITVFDSTAVQAPTALRVASISDGVVTFRWTPSIAGSQPTAYVLEAGLAPGQTIATAPTSTAVPLLSLPVPAGVFYVRVRATGAGQTSPPSNEILVHAGAALPPSAPARLLATVRDSSVDLSWLTTYGGGVPTGSVLAVSGAAAGEYTLPGGDHASFVGVPGGTYHLALRVTNAAGSSAPTAPVTITVPTVCTGPPQPPVDILAFTSGNNAFVTWEPPATGAAPSAYIVDVVGLGSVTTTRRSVSGAVPPGAYTVVVRSTNACGTSTPSATQSVTVP